MKMEIDSIGVIKFNKNVMAKNLKKYIPEYNKFYTIKNLKNYLEKKEIPQCDILFVYNKYVRKVIL